MNSAIATRNSEIPKNATLTPGSPCMPSQEKEGTDVNRDRRTERGEKSEEGGSHDLYNFISLQLYIYIFMSL